jgi:arginine repressor
VARVIDLAALPGILGTVAGDDTILIVAQDAGAGRPLVQSFRKMMA